MTVDEVDAFGRARGAGEARPAEGASEAEWQAWIVAHIEAVDGRWMHVGRPDGAQMPEGWPDLAIFLPRLQLKGGRCSRILYRELKRDGEEPTDAQHAWLTTILACAGDVAVWHFPSDADRALREIGWHRPAASSSPMGEADVAIDPELLAEARRWGPAAVTALVEQERRRQAR